MEEIRDLQLRQRDLLQAWLATADGARRFAILSELRAVERQIEGKTLDAHMRAESVRTFTI